VIVCAVADPLALAIGLAVALRLGAR
jgi:hypothetical protein